MRANASYLDATRSVGTSGQRHPLRLQPVPVSPEVERTQLRLRLADQVALTDEHLIALCGFGRYVDRLALTRSGGPERVRSSA